jgi:CDP-4-dehydro-6-deoxyglucose reductase, E1
MTGKPRDPILASDEAMKARKQVLDSVSEFATAFHGERAFVPGETPVPVSGRVFDERDVRSLVDSALDFWLTTGRFNDAFEKRLGKLLDRKYVLSVNSGSSANLLSVAALTSPSLGKKALKAGDEIITVAAGFPTTVNPALQHGLVPVFVDVTIPTYNINVSALEQALGPKTRAVMIAHTLGNPFDLKTVSAFCRDHGLWLIEDCCDALGSTFNGRPVGTFGDIGTLSFYPAHHITMGEGGAVFTGDSVLKRSLESFRDWGRDCWCAPGADNTCKKRFDWKRGDLPEGYDHKYIYSHAGYNLKITDMQAAIGLSQLDRVDDFKTVRKRNFQYLNNALKGLEDVLILPEATPHSDPSWFGFPITLRDNAPFLREDLLRLLDERLIGTRLLFGGNLIHQPYMQGRLYRTIGALPETDRIMRNTFWLGVFPGLSEAMLDYVLEVLHDFVKARQ